MSRIRDRITYANVMSTIAVFGVLGGGAYAASELDKNEVKSKHVKDSSIKGVDVKDDALSGADVDESSLTLPQGPVGPPGPTGPQGADGTGGPVITSVDHGVKNLKTNNNFILDTAPLPAGAAGRYLVTTNTTIRSVTGPAIVECGVSKNRQAVKAQSAVARVGAPNDHQGLSTTAVLDLAVGDRLSLGCSSSGEDDVAAALAMAIVALRVGT